MSNDERGALHVQLEQQGDTTLEATELTWADQMILQGREQGLREMILRLARARFGGVSPALEQAVGAMTGEDALLDLFDRTLRATNEAELLPAP